MRIFITGGPMHGKTTRAAAEAQRMGLQHFCCTDTEEQAAATGRLHPMAMYAPPHLKGKWSELSQWVSDVWLNSRGRIVVEGVAVPRALRKWRAVNHGEPPPCEMLIWLSAPCAPQTPKQKSMTKAHDTVLRDVLDEWPGLNLALIIEP